MLDKDWLKKLAGAFALAWFCVFVAMILGSLSAVVLPYKFEFSTYFVRSDTEISLDEVRNRISALERRYPGIGLAVTVLEGDAGAPSGCGTASVLLNTSIHVRFWRGRDIDDAIIRRAYEAGLGAACSRTQFTITSSSGALSTGQSVIALAILVLIWRSRRGGRPFRVNWSDWSPNTSLRGALVWGVAGGAVVSLAVLASGSIAVAAGVSKDVPVLLPTTTPELLALLPLMVVGAPIFEEFVFRAWLLERLGRDLPAWAALVLSTGAFVAAHLPQSILEWVVLFTAGLVLGLLWWRTRSLVACVIAHALYNAVLLASVWPQVV